MYRESKNKTFKIELQKNSQGESYVIFICISQSELTPRVKGTPLCDLCVLFVVCHTMSHHQKLVQLSDRVRFTIMTNYSVHRNGLFLLHMQIKTQLNLDLFQWSCCLKKIKNMNPSV